MQSFGARLVAVVSQRGPLCVGIDPHAQLIAEWGLPDTPEGLAQFCQSVVEAVADRVAVVKPQSAFFERFGSAGIAVLESTIRQCRERGALVLLDVKRGDIGSTAAGYAQAYLHPRSSLWVDAITVNPYLGFGSLTPFLEHAAQHGGGVFVVARTSNEEGRQVQGAIARDGRSVAQTMVDEASARNAGVQPLGSVGVVVGATAGTDAPDLSSLNGPVLAPGLGAQGAAADDLEGPFANLAGLLLPAISRDVLRYGPDVDRLREAVERWQSNCRKVVKIPSY